MWEEMTDNLYRQRSNKERLHYENDSNIKYDKYTDRNIQDQEIYETENAEIDCAEQGYYIVDFEGDK